MGVNAGCVKFLACRGSRHGRTPPPAASQTQSNHFFRRSRMNLIVFSARSGVVVPLPFSRAGLNKNWRRVARLGAGTRRPQAEPFQITRWLAYGIARSEEYTSELQSLRH